MLNIKKGENALIKRFLKKKDKTDFNRTEFTTMSVDLVQNGVTIQSYAFPDSYLRAGTALNEIELEISTTVSSKFKGGKVVAYYTFVVPDADLEDSAYTIIVDEELLDVENVP
jgi:hypothetical protein